MDISNILKQWGIDSLSIRSDIFVPGSSERCVQRHVLEDEDGAVWVLERLFPKQHERRERIGQALERLRGAGLPVLYYRRSAQGGFVAQLDGYHWQLAPHVPGDRLPQPDFVDDAERGRSLGDFLVRLHRAGAAVHELDETPDFDLPGYVDELLETVRTRQPGLHGALVSVRPALTPLFEVWGDLPRCLCHGDFHPLNVIWRGMDVAAVIDWEFAGPRPVLYDAANCLGCVGIEDPGALNAGLAPAMLESMGQGGMLDGDAMRFFPHMLLGMRFAWMSEWLRRNDREMQNLESDYMNLLARNLDGLSRIWSRFGNF
ncbi:phosphotransferase enzyme family protein [Pseudodesulfovibrio senegalensis]|jgi:homoserine kinase type II|uniref:Phosphotransferase n=1 Tax=Pseudodesulfovibrio senegalensis TaxID=1721087 RepID=A0A6N6N555_9BACT|nr:phosphotransferase [Pseudodesulfovibrio senegalensis]KAB1443312.1 phosphotransferase [Pseudodesulfovibrio senegalensis]